MTTTAIIGLGNMGKGLAKRLAGKTDLILSARDGAAANAFAATLPAGVTVLDRDAIDLLRRVCPITMREPLQRQAVAVKVPVSYSLRN